MVVKITSTPYKAIMADLKNIMREEKRNLILSIFFLIITFLLTLTFARGMEGKSYLFHLLEYLGGPDVALETNMLGIVVVIFIIVFYLLHRGLYDKIHYLDIKYKYLKYLPIMFIVISIAFYFLGASVQQALLGMDHGLDTVIDESRIGTNYCSFGYDEEGDPSDFGHRVNLINHGSEKVSFFIKFVEFNKPENSYIIKGKDGAPTEVTIEPGARWDYAFRITDINPDFVSNRNKGVKRPRYHVVIYNSTESHTFFTYD